MSNKYSFLDKVWLVCAECWKFIQGIVCTLEDVSSWIKFDFLLLLLIEYYFLYKFKLKKVSQDLFLVRSIILTGSTSSSNCAFVLYVLPVPTIATVIFLMMALDFYKTRKLRLSNQNSTRSDTSDGGKFFRNCILVPHRAIRLVTVQFSSVNFSFVYCLFVVAVR